MNWTLEVVVVPVFDVAAAIAFYREGLGFNLDLDLDHDSGGAYRVVQLTPPGSGCSIQLSHGITTMAPARSAACNSSCRI